MSKPSFVISCPINTYSGYGARSRDVVKALIELDKYEVKIDNDEVFVKVFTKELNW